MKNVVKNAVTGKGKSRGAIWCGVVLGFLVAVAGCERLTPVDTGDGSEPIEDVTKQSHCDKDVIVSATEFENAPYDWLMITDMKIVNNCLKIKFQSGGCDGSTWKVELIDGGVIMESYPCQRILRLSLDNKEICDALPVKEMSFNIEALQIQGNKAVTLHICTGVTNIVAKTILYEY